MEKLTTEIEDREMGIIQQSFLEWCEKSGYVTGAWSTGEDVDPDKKGEYYDFLRMTASEQLTSIIKKNLTTDDSGEKI